MLNWAENEVKIASPNYEASDDGWDYVDACYKSALKAYKSLCNDGHSGLSFSITKSVLERLMNGLPLTPIEDTDDGWELIDSDDERQTFQCNRMFSLFKDVYTNGEVKYHDNNRIVCVDNDNDNVSYHSGLVNSICNDLYPITMPYFPQDKPTRIYCETFLVDENNGDFDTKGILYAVKPDGERIEINRYFKDSATSMGYDEIDFQEYTQRKNMKIR